MTPSLQATVHTVQCTILKYVVSCSLSENLQQAQITPGNLRRFNDFNHNAVKCIMLVGWGNRVNSASSSWDVTSHPSDTMWVVAGAMSSLAAIAVTQFAGRCIFRDRTGVCSRSVGPRDQMMDRRREVGFKRILYCTSTSTCAAV